MTHYQRLYVLCTAVLAIIGLPTSHAFASVRPPISIAAAIQTLKIGDNDLRISIKDADGAPVSEATVTTSVNMTNMDMGEAQPFVTDLGRGRYRSIVDFVMRGPWKVTLTVAVPGKLKPQSASFDFVVTAHSPTRHHLCSRLNAAQQKKADGSLLGLWMSKGGQPDVDQAGKVTVAQIQKALSRGADVNAQTEFDVTSLMMAARSGNIVCLKYLISKGGDVNAQDSSGWSALHWACNANWFDSAKLLVANGADVNVKNIVGGSALFYAVESDDIDCARYLISKGAKINAQNTDGTTPLIQASYEGSVGCLKLLLATGADVNLKDSEGNTAMSVGISHTNIVALLKAAGAR